MTKYFAPAFTVAIIALPDIFFEAPSRIELLHTGFTDVQFAIPCNSSQISRIDAQT